MSFKKMFSISSLVVVIVLMAWGSLFARPRPADPPPFRLIYEVSLIDPLNLEGSGGHIIIWGKGFGTIEPVVSLGMYGDLVLTSYDDGEIMAELPSALDIGEYVLKIFPESNPKYMLTYDLTISVPGVPAGMIAFFPSTSCPPGWSEEEAARGRTVVGLQDPGTAYGTVGTELLDMENRGHDHDLNLSAGTTGTAGDHAHTGLVSFAGQHSHGGQTGAPSATKSVDGDDEFQTGAASTDHYHDIDPSVNHSHIVQADAGHVHSLGGSSSTSSAAYTSQTMPYLQLLACIKD